MKDFGKPSELVMLRKGTEFKPLTKSPTRDANQSGVLHLPSYLCLTRSDHEH